MSKDPCTSSHEEQCTFPCKEVCKRKDCPYKPKDTSSPPYGVIGTVSGFSLAMAITSSPTGQFSQVLNRAPVPQPPPVTRLATTSTRSPTMPSSPRNVNPNSSNPITEYLDICLQEGWKTLLPISNVEDLAYYFFPEFDNRVPQDPADENAVEFALSFREAIAGCDFAYFLDRTHPNRDRILRDTSAETGGIIDQQPDYPSQMINRLMRFGGARLPNSNRSIERFVFPYFLSEFREVIKQNSDELVFVQGNNTPVKQSLDASSLTIELIEGFTILKFNQSAFQTYTPQQKAAMKTDVGWIPVILPSGNPGYISSQNAYPSHGPRLIMRQENGVWSYDFSIPERL